jgi:hypothetical protein
MSSDFAIDEKGYRWENVLSSSTWTSFFPALLRLESKLIVAACEFVRYVKKLVQNEDDNTFSHL